MRWVNSSLMYEKSVCFLFLSLFSRRSRLMISIVLVAIYSIYTLKQKEDEK